MNMFVHTSIPACTDLHFTTSVCTHTLATNYHSIYELLVKDFVNDMISARLLQNSWKSFMTLFIFYNAVTPPHSYSLLLFSICIRLWLYHWVNRRFQFYYTTHLRHGGYYQLPWTRFTSQSSVHSSLFSSISMCNGLEISGFYQIWEFYHHGCFECMGYCRNCSLLHFCVSCWNMGKFLTMTFKVQL